MKKLLLLLFLPLIVQTAGAQMSQSDAQAALKKLSSKIDRSNRDKRSPDYSKGFERTPLIFEKWHYGKLFFNDNTSMDTVRFNFDIDLNTVVVQFDESISPVGLKTEVVESFILHDQGADRQFIRKQKEDFKDIKYRMPFFEVLTGNEADGQPTVLKQYQKGEVSEDNKSSYKPVGFKADGQQTVYNFRALYFIKTEGDAVYRKFGMSKKRILGLFDKAKGKEISAYVKSNKLKWNDEAEMIRLIEKFYQ